MTLSMQQPLRPQSRLKILGAHVHAVEHAGGLGRVDDLAEAEDELLVDSRVEAPALVQARLQLRLRRLRHALLEQALQGAYNNPDDIPTLQY